MIPSAAPASATTEAAAESAPPIRAGERLEALDVLRGLAVLGILVVNASSFAMPGGVRSDPYLSPLPFDPTDQALWWVMATFFEQKFVTLFSMLFGASVFLVGGERRQDPQRARVLQRRLWWLMLFGVLHGALIWWGDILLLYGAVGWVMLLCRSWRPTRLVWVGALGVALTTLLLVGVSIAMQGPETAEAQAKAALRFSRRMAEFQDGLLGSGLANVKQWVPIAVFSIVIFGPLTLGLMMWGLALLKLGVLQGRASTRTYLVLTLAGAAALAVIGWSALNTLRDRFPSETEGYDMVANFTLAAVVTLGYVGLVNLGLRNRLARPALMTLAPVGRMAFTNYIAQSVIMTTIFYSGRGLGLFGRLDWTAWAAIVAAIWVLQVGWSHYWLQRHAAGPLERVWRRLSQGSPTKASAGVT